MEDDEFEEIISVLKKAFATVNGKKTEQSIANARKLWIECLKEAGNNLEKARELYDTR